MLFSLILLVSCVGSSAHGSAQPDKVVRDVPAPNTGSGSDGRFAKSKLQLRLLRYFLMTTYIFSMHALLQSGTFSCL